ncbi:MAG: histidine phosphatase family protein [Deltaproteobacteria bacterium]|nr:histidine phosphatase family protein [Deltaproteobacteria bacterium]
MLELWLVRHAESEANAGLVGDVVDCALSHKGVRETDRLRAHLAPVRFDAIHSSDLRRCAQTASLAMPDSTIQFDARLRELVTGPETAVVDLDKLGLDAVLRSVAAPEQPAESGLAFRARVKAWLDELPKTGRVLAFTHTQVVREVLSLLLSSEARPTSAVVANASITRMEIAASTTRLVAFAAIDHLG